MLMVSVGAYGSEAEKQVADTGKENSPALQEESPVSVRIREERKARRSTFVLIPHKPNYILPLTWNDSPNEAPFSSDGEHLDNEEVKFQISIKVPLLEDVIKDNGDLYFAYTNQSWWQAYNKDISSPFRETNHEPELFFIFENSWEIMGFKNSHIALGLVHQSNGRGGTLSRSWNRLYANFIFERENLVLSFKPWYRLPEDEKDSPDDPGGDDNPDIADYMGYGEFRAAYEKNRHTFSMMLRNNMRSDNKGAVQLDWSFPMTRRLKGYVQYFYGYGESLVDYNARTNRLGVGILLTDWL